MPDFAEEVSEALYKMDDELWGKGIRMDWTWRNYPYRVEIEFKERD